MIIEFSTTFRVYGPYLHMWSDRFRHETAEVGTPPLKNSRDHRKERE